MTLKMLTSTPTFKNNKSSFPVWIEACFLLAFLVSFVSFLFPQIKSGVLMGVYFILVVVYVVFLRGYSFKKFDFIALFFLMYNLVASIVSIGNGNSINSSFGELSSGILPIALFFIGRSCSQKNEKTIIKLFFVGAIFSFFVGYYFYIFRPAIYYDFLKIQDVNFYVEKFTTTPRFTSFFSGTTTGCFACIVFSYIVSRLFCKNKKSTIIFLLLMIFVSAGAAILSLERVAWLCLILVAISYALFLSKHKLRNFLLLLVSFVVTLLFAFRFFDFESIFIWRIETSSEIFSERSSNWFAVFEQSPVTLLFGNGLGIAGHRSVNQFKIHDGNYFKMIYEIGLIGFSCFILVTIYAIITGIKKYNKTKNISYAFYLSVIFILLVHAIGSSAFTFQTPMALFWFAVGSLLKKAENDQWNDSKALVKSLTRNNLNNEQTKD